MASLLNRTALVTGSGAPGGIGYSIARLLKEEGATVLITSTTDRIHDRGRELGCSSFVADLSDYSSVAQLAANVGAVDILVNNAGMTSLTNHLQEDELQDLATITESAWRRGIERNLDTAFFLTQALIPRLRDSKAGRIIFISSVTGAKMAMHHQPAYATAKAAMVGLMRSIAVDEAIHGITANAILPGWIATDTQPKWESEQGLRTPLGRSGRPEEIASLVAWLASEGSGYMTGQCLVMDGGNSIAEERG